MKKVFFGISILCMSIMLAGCTIPIGDDVLKISTDGISFEQQEAVSDDIEEVDTEAADENNEGNSEQEESNSEAEEDLADEAEATTGTEASDECDDDYSVITDELDIPMLDCAEITTVSQTDQYINATYVAPGNWNDVFDMYKEFLGDDLSSQKQSPQAENATVEGTMDGGSISFKIHQEDELVTVRLVHYFKN